MRSMFHSESSTIMFRHCRACPEMQPLPSVALQFKIIELLRSQGFKMKKLHIGHACVPSDRGKTM